MPQRTVRAVVNQQPCRISGLGRTVRNQVRGQLETEIGDTHVATLYILSPGSPTLSSTAEVILTWVQCALLVPLAVLGLHRGWILLQYLRTRRQRAPHVAARPAEWPRVTIQLPIFNERLVAGRLVEQVAEIDYPRDRLEIQVLDDSTDDTSEIVRKVIEQLPGDLHVEHVRRTDRTGYKAGALAHGLTVAKGELIAVFDADFLPPRNFLRDTVPHMQDERIGMVQTRWGHLNPDYSVLTDVQRTLLDGHFVVEHHARARNGCFFNFNGTAGLFRRACIDDAGGWQHDTLTEDMDLSYRAQLNDWKFTYLPDVVCPAELPVEMNAFLSQQHRWAKGSTQTARKLLGRILRAEVPLHAKAEAGFHLLGNTAFPLLMSLILVALPLQLLRVANHSHPPMWLRTLEAMPLLFATACLLFYYGFARLGAGTFRLATLFRLPLVFAIGAGMCANNTAAVFSALRRNPGEFRRTPKRDVVEDTTTLRASTYRSPRGATPWIECALGVWASVTAITAFSIGIPWTGVFHGLFAIGLTWAGFRSVTEDVRGRAATPSARVLPANP